MMNSHEYQVEESGIAIVGLAGRFPGANDVAELWKNLKQGIDSISHFTVEELEVRNAKTNLNNPDYVTSRGVLQDADLFDADLFNIHPKEAELIDPQHRVFLECCWEALEDSGRDPSRISELTGVFAGCSQNSYFLTQVCQDESFLREYAEAYQSGYFPTLLGTISDTLATRVSYKLNLQGPSMTVACACSTSLVAVSQACGSLASFQCDMALAGGVSISFPQKRGYVYEPGGMLSRDGRCRSFDADAEGTVFGGGAGVVVLKRYEDALRDGDHIYAVIRGTAVNNDGKGKVGYTAPGVDGQVRVVAMAQALANVDPRTISYIEAHGTATPLGDPVEVEALTQVFRETTNDTGFCALGTVKTNIGHLDIASGVTGLIRTALSLKHRQLTPTPHFHRANPALRLETSPFYVNTELRDWPSPAGQPRRAGVSAFGLGGTNCHVVLEEAPSTEGATDLQVEQLLVISARSPEALREAKARLADHFLNHPTSSLSDAAHTLQTGRTAFPCRSAVVCGSVAEAATALGLKEECARSRGSEKHPRLEAPSISFLFSGQGSQYSGMGSGLYKSEPYFREIVDECAAILQPLIGFDIRTVAFTEFPVDAESIHHTRCAQPGIFILEYALARLWMHWGLQAAAMVGHSIGEFVCACIAGVLSLEDALRIVAERAKLMSGIETGAMLAIRLSESELQPLLNSHSSLAAVNAEDLTVAAGTGPTIAALEEELRRLGVAAMPLRTSHAFHSSMMDPIVPALADFMQSITLNKPKARWISCVTGNWITDAEAMDPRYWASHCRKTVRFAAAIGTLSQETPGILLEAGPGTTAQTLARQSLPAHSGHLLLSSIRGESFPPSRERTYLLETLGQLWVAGIQPDWDKVSGGRRYRRVSLPTSPFQRQRFWVDKRDSGAAAVPAAIEPLQNESKPKEILFIPEPTIMPVITGVTPHRQAHDQTRIESFSEQLKALLEELSGLDAGQIDPQAGFLELGFDSLFLTQFAQAIFAKFSVKVTFRQLLDQLASVAAVAAFLDRQVPSNPNSTAAKTTVPAPAPVSPVVTLPVASVAAAAGKPAIERIIEEQLQVMSRLMADQLVALRGPMASESKAQLPTAAAAVTRVAVSPAAAEPPKVYEPFKPVQRSIRLEMTPRRQAYVDSLIQRYTERTQGSKSLTQRYRKVLADPRVAAGFRIQWKEMIYPITVQRSLGSHLWDVDGNEYVDLVNGFGPISFGHRPDFVVEALSAQLNEGIEIGPQTPLAGEVAELLCELTGMERATFCNTGSEAVMAAVRLARTVTGRNKIVYFAGDYHGNYEEVLIKRTGRGTSLTSNPMAPGITKEAAANVIVLEYGTDEALRIIREHTGELAAVLVEAVQSRHPNLQPREFLQELRDITSAAGTALIFDEIVTGFRVHPGGAQAMFGIQADLATYGKILGGGMPIGAVAGKASFMDALDGGMWKYGDDSFPEADVTFFAGTFVRHPLALAAARAVLRHIKESGTELQESLTIRTARLTARLNQIFEQYGLNPNIETCGSWFYWSFPSDFQFGSLFYFHLREKGIHILEGFPCFLTTAHSDADLARIESAFADACREMAEGDVLPVAANQKTAALEPGVPAVLAPMRIEAPLTEAQMEIWLSTQLSSEAACAFNESFCLRLRGNLNETVLRSSLDEVIRRHDALRTRFDSAGPSMILTDTSGMELPLLDFSDLQAREREARLSTLLAVDAETPFDLTAAPPIRGALVRLEESHHVLLLTAHHIICDGWSINVMLGELASIYSAKCGAVSGPLPEPSSYLQYAHELKRNSDTLEQAEVERYWLDKFREPAPVLDLPVDRPRPSVKSFAGATCRRRIDADVYRAIKHSGARQGATLMATLLAGFQSLLFRLTGQEDVVVGIPSAAQALLENPTMVGHCVNFLPVRAKLKSGSTFAALLRDVRKDLLDAWEHQTYTFGTLVKRLAIKRDPSRSPLIEVQFNLERVADNLQMHGLKTEVESNPKAAVNFDLFLNIVEAPDGLTLDCDYNRDLLEEATVQRWLSHYIVLLTAAAEQVDCGISTLPLLGKADLYELLFERNNTYADYPKDIRIDELVDLQTSILGESIAVAFEDKTLTYTELSARTNRLGRYLAARGVGLGTRVAVLLERSETIPEALLAILKCGAAYVPLDTAMPLERMRSIIRESGATLLLVNDSKAVSSLVSQELETVHLDIESAAIRKESCAPLPCAVDSTATAYVIFTSGSTGKPKGVEVTHRSVVNLLWSVAGNPGIAPNDRLLAVTTLSFDIAGLEIFLPLVKGARLVVASKVSTMDGFLLANRIREAEITMLQATPSTWRLLLEAGWQPNPGVTMLCGGEALPRQLAESLLVNQAPLWNMYGPTETTIWSSISKVRSGEGPVPIGPPIANTQFYVLTRDMQPCPVGVAGELYIGGDGVAVGYFGRSDLTARNFLPNPFIGVPGARLYKTGDKVRALPNGELEFLGRLDNQIKRNGFRIELGEIESAAASYPGVKEVAVALMELKPGDDRLVAYVVMREGQNFPTLAAWRDSLSTVLPAYMVPSHFVPLEQLPRTPNGKIARNNLPKPELKSTSLRRESSPPATPAEAKLVEICREVLGFDDLQVDDDLFECGADSIRIFQIAARAEKSGLNISALLLMKGRTVAASCRLIPAAQSTTSAPQKTRIERSPREQFMMKPEVMASRYPADAGVYTK